MLRDELLSGAAAVADLTNGQRECLRLVQALQSSKQIARRLGISRYTVDQRLMLACRKLGVRSRVEAALLLAEHEGRVVFEPAPERMALSQLDGAPRADEPQVRITAAQTGRQTGVGLVLPIPHGAVTQNRLTTVQRLGWTLAIGAASIILFGVLMAALTTLKNFV